MKNNIFLFQFLVLKLLLLKRLQKISKKKLFKSDQI